MFLSRLSVRLAALLGISLLTGVLSSATRVTGVFKVPNGQTPQIAGVRVVGTIAGVSVYGYVDFRPTDQTGNTPQAIICAGTTYLPHTIRAYIRGDGQLIDSTTALGVELVPTVGCQPTKTVDQARVFIGRIGTSADFFWSEYKEIPSQPVADWGVLPLAAPSAPVYIGYRQIYSNGQAMPARTKLKITGTAGICSDDSTNDATDCQLIGVGSVSMSLENPTPADSGKFQWKPRAPLVISRISCSTDIGSVDINFEVRAETTPNATGVNVATSSLTCNATAPSLIVFSSATVPSDSPVALIVTSVSSGPSIVRISLEYNLQ